MGPLERILFRLSGIDATHGMDWKEHLRALLTINMVWFLWTMFVLMDQGWLPWNPDGNPSMSADLAFNTAISFVVNCDLQHYSGETGATLFSQVFGLMFLQFVSAGTGMASAAVVFNALKERTTDKLGNFYDYFLKSMTRVLLPLSLVVAVLLMLNGTPQTAVGQDSIVTLEGDSVQVARGPVSVRSKQNAVTRPSRSRRRRRRRPLRSLPPAPWQPRNPSWTTPRPGIRHP